MFHLYLSLSTEDAYHKFDLHSSEDDISFDAELFELLINEIKQSGWKIKDNKLTLGLIVGEKSKGYQSAYIGMFHYSYVPKSDRTSFRVSFDLDDHDFPSLMSELSDRYDKWMSEPDEEVEVSRTRNKRNQDIEFWP